MDLYKLMNNSEFREFYNKYFTVWTNIDTMIMYFKLYEIIEISFFKKFNRNITKKKEILFLLNNIIKNNLLRKIVIDNYILFKNSEQKYLTTNNIKYIE